MVKNMMASLIIDIVFAGILVICILVAWRKGFVQTILSFFGFIAAALISMYSCAQVSMQVYKNLIEQPLYESIYKKVLTLVPTGEIINNVENIGDVLPGMVKTLFDLAATQANQRIGETLSGTAEMVSHTVLDSLVAPLVMALLNLVIFFVLFGVLMVIVNILVTVVGKVFELPVLGSINHFFGAVIGVVNGVLVCMVAATLLTLFATVTANASSGVNTTTLEATYIASIFIRYNPILPMVT
ncbi:MAG: CvpA family protein [Acetanaerobacterium sp.]